MIHMARKPGFYSSYDIRLEDSEDTLIKLVWIRLMAAESITVMAWHSGSFYLHLILYIPSMMHDSGYSTRLAFDITSFYIPLPCNQ